VLAFSTSVLDERSRRAVLDERSRRAVLDERFSTSGSRRAFSSSVLVERSRRDARARDDH
jgi:hypothetical protein